MREFRQQQPPPLLGESQSPSITRKQTEMQEQKQSQLLNNMVNLFQESQSSSKETARLFVKQNQIFGREQELRLLDCVYQRVSKSQSEIVLIHGPCGVGKSTILEAFIQTLPSNAFYASGKFDQLQSHAPYAALVNASDDLCLQALKQRNSSENIRGRIKELLGSEINLLGSLIPTIAKMMAGDDKTEDDDKTYITAPGQGFTRFKLLFRAFLRCVASSENPVVLFLDDIQWADPASLEVLGALVTDSLSKHIMIIVAYRESEIDIDVLLQRYNLSNSGDGADNDNRSQSSSASDHKAQITDIEVTGLTVHSLNELIASVLGINKQETMLLSALVLNKTDGNVFYALNFLDMLLTRSLLSKSAENGSSWIWSEERILQETNVSDNLAAILETKLRRLPEQTRSILQIASFIGHSFTTEVLVTIAHEEQDMLETVYTFDKHPRNVIYDRIIVALKAALAEGLLETRAETDKYKFSHDRIQQSLYFDLMPDEVERGLLHQRIGSLVWNSVKHNRTSDSANWVFLAAQNLNRAVDLIDYKGTRYELIEVNLRAAKFAMEKSAFHVASKYLRTAVNLLEGDVSWDKHYELCINLYYSAAEAEKSIGCHEHSQVLVVEIHKRAKSFQEQLAAYCIEVQSLAAQGNIEEAIKLGLFVLHKVGIQFPKKITMATVAKELALTKIVMGRRKLEDLAELPEMTDERMTVALSLMNIIVVNAFILGDSYKDTFAAMSIRMVRTTIRHGFSPLYSSMALAAWGIVHAALGQLDVSVRAAQVAIDTVDKFSADPVRGRVMIANYNASFLWRRALDYDVHNAFLQAYHLAMSFGDLNFGYHGFVGWLVSGIFLDLPLDDMHRRVRSVVAEGREYESTCLLMFILPGWQVLLNLSGDAENLDPSELLGESLDKDFTMEMKAIDSKMALLYLHQCELKMAYTYENWNLVQEILPLNRKLENEAAGYFMIGFNCSWNAASHYELYLVNGKKKHRREGRRCHSRVTKWATTGTIMLSGVNAWLSAVPCLSLHFAEKEPGACCTYN